MEAQGTVGLDIPYTVELVEAQGTIAEDLEWTIQSDIEELAYTKEYIVPSVAGDHVLTFTAEHEGEDIYSRCPSCV